MLVMYDSTKYYVYIPTDKISVSCANKKGHTPNIHPIYTQYAMTRQELIMYLLNPKKFESQDKSIDVSNFVQVMGQENNLTADNKSKKSKQKVNMEDEQNAPTKYQENVEYNGTNYNSPSSSPANVKNVENNLQPGTDAARNPEDRQWKNIAFIK